MERKPQTLANHAKLDEAFHFFLSPISLLNLGYAIYRFQKAPSLDGAWMLIFGVAFIVLILKLRIYPLKVQDRVIRLEERLRLREVLPENLRSRIGELTESQLVALRFAADSELPELVRTTLDQKLTNKQIKQAIRQWRPDYFRV